MYKKVLLAAGLLVLSTDQKRNKDSHQRLALRNPNSTDAVHNEPMTIQFTVIIEPTGAVDDWEERYPWCLGAVITKWWVLTSAFCVTDEYQLDIFATDGSSWHTKRVLKQISHPAFQTNWPKYVHLRLKDYPVVISNDIALMRIEELDGEVAFIHLSAVDYISILGLQVQLIAYNDNDTLVSSEEAISKCRDIDFIRLGPALCSTHECDGSDYRHASGTPLLLNGKLIGVQAASRYTEKLVTRFTPVSPFLHWIRLTIINEARRG